MIPGTITPPRFTVTAARALENGMDLCVVRYGLPSEAANLAALNHAPERRADL